MQGKKLGSTSYGQKTQLGAERRNDGVEISWVQDKGIHIVRVYTALGSATTWYRGINYQVAKDIYDRAVKTA